MKNWKYVLPATLLIVILALVIYSASLKQPSSKLLVVPSSGTLTAVAGTFYQVEPDSTTGRWIDYGDPELYKDGALAYVTPPVGVQPAQLKIDGVLFPNYACYLDVECRGDWIRVADKDSWDSDPRYNLVATFSVPSPTPFPVCTPVACPSGNYVCPSGDCVGGCGMVCAENPIDYEIVETNVNVRVYFRGLGSDGKPKDLNERHTHSLYNFSDGYRLPHCDFMPTVDLSECSQEPTFLLYVIRVTDGLPYDVGYWGAINENTWIALYIERSDMWYTDWRPPGWQSSL